ncbi:MBL fold metallo-hydrolase [Epibacterium sp. MM17-32]|uniref:MBL fold metallo-hydrolase n=1 Tax=Epibacterium sp. MM17-32 TaxID=2917734 RepID=UPI001EF4D9ED|nr:MBL fold metallo-hydrolase [Epibacterium sp. MM17-32]MCG7626303.1 MBL fold metallo-hydrolase [Epibacterium sp. MM17-32]
MNRPQADTGFNPKPGVPEEVAPGVRRLLAPNPSAMTYRGTNTYLVGDSEIAVIDPGPASDAHLEAILNAVQPGGRIGHILVTHSHLDHSPLAAALREATGAPVYAHGTATTGRSAIMAQLAAEGMLGGGEGIDHGFVCDHTMADGDIITGAGWQIEALHTPGHIGNHLCFAIGGLLFSGDHVMGWASSLVSPPDGDLTDFMASCARLQQRRWTCFLPGHGDLVHDPAERLAWLIAHRKRREADILEQLAHGAADAPSLARHIYRDTPDALLPAAERNVLAHLVDLYQRGRVRPTATLARDATFELCR